MKYNIIEDCPPHYVKFTHPDVDKIVNICKAELASLDIPNDKFVHHVLSTKTCNELMKVIPFSDLLKVKSLRMSLFISPPGYRHPVHRDSPYYNYVSINYGIEVVDDKCVALWYADDVCSKHVKETNLYNKEFIKTMSLHEVPSQQLKTPEGQCALLNTDIFHTWHNNSPYRRVVLTLRLQEDPTRLMTYDVVRNILFNNGNVA